MLPTTDGRLALIVPGDGVAILDLLTAGELRAVLREAVRRPRETPYEVPIGGRA